MMQYLYVALGGALGSMARFWLNNVITNQHKLFEIFPMGTMVINITGSFIIAFFAALTATEGAAAAPPNLRIFFMAGICGGYTTFSSFSLQTLQLAQERQWLYAGLNVLGSVTLCLGATWLGYIIGAALRPTKGV